ncbi:tape measure protein [Fibrella sp. WM1]|uniref:tape measure protein n=1 Tax=Fibrella musci TaxID=3242485 RepID=UPI003520F6F8
MSNRDQTIRFRFAVASELPSAIEQLQAIKQLVAEQGPVAQKAASALQQTYQQGITLAKAAAAEQLAVTKEVARQETIEKQAALDRQLIQLKESEDRLTTAYKTAEKERLVLAAELAKELTAEREAELRKQEADLKAHHAAELTELKAALNRQAAEYDAALKEQARQAEALRAQELADQKHNLNQQTAALLAELQQQTIGRKAEADQQTAIVRQEQLRQTALLRQEIGQQNQLIRSQPSAYREVYGELRTLIMAAFGVQEILDFGKGVIEAKGKVDIFAGGLTQMLGSKQQADQLMIELTKLAVSTPFQVEDLMTVTGRLKAMGVATAELIPTVKMLGDIAAVAGTEKLPLVAKAYTDIMSKGRLFKAETNQMVENNVPLYDLLAVSMGKTRDQVVKMAEAHEISFAHVKKALQDATSEGGRYYRMMEMQAETMAGQVSNLADKFFFAKARLGDYVQHGLQKVIGGTSDLIDVLAGSDSAIDRTAKWVRTAVVAWTGYEVIVNRARIAEVAANVTRAASVAIGGTYNLTLISMAGTTEGFTAAQVRSAVAGRSLWAVVVANPIGALLTAVTAITVAMSAWDAVTTEVTDAVGEQETKLRTELGLITQSVELAKQAKQGTVERAMAIQYLVNKYPEYFAGINSEKTSNGDLDRMLKQVNRSYQDRIALARETYRVEVNGDRLRELHKTEQEIMQLAAQRLPKELLIQINGDPAKLLKALDESSQYTKQFNGGMRAQWDDLWHGMGSGATVALRTVVKNISEVEKQNLESTQRRDLMRQGETKSMLDAEMTRHQNAMEAAKGSSAELLAEKKRHEENLSRLQDTGSTTRIATATAEADKVKEIEVFAAHDREAFMKGHFARSYEQQLAAMAAQERAEMDAANKRIVSKKAAFGVEKQFEEAVKAQLIAIHEKYEQKRAQLRADQLDVLMDVVEQEQGIEKEAAEAIAALQVWTTKDRKQQEQARLKAEKEANAERKKDIRELQQEIEQAERETAQIKKKNMADEIEGRKQVFGLVVDLVAQQSGLMGSIAGLAKKTFADWDALSGKSLEVAKANLQGATSVYEGAMTKLFEVYKTGDAQQIKAQEGVVAAAKKNVADNQATVSQVATASTQATLGLISMGYQLVTQLVEMFNAAERAKWQATAEAAGRTRDILDEFYKASRQQNRDYLDEQLALTERTYDEQIELVRNFYRQEKEVAAYQRRTDDYLAFIQKIAEIRASDMDDEAKVMQTLDEVRRFNQTKGLRERIEQLELEKAELKEVHELRLKQIEEAYEAEKDRTEKAIDLAKEAFEQQKELLEGERDKQKEAIEAQLAVLKDAYDQKRDLAQEEYDRALQQINDRYEAEKQAVRDAYEYRKSLVEQSKADELEATGIIDRLRDEALERYRTTETDKLIAQRDRILATLTDEAEKARVVNEYEKRIQQVHKDVEDAKLDKSKANTLVSKQLKEEEKDLTEKLKEEETQKVLELEKRQKEETEALKTQLKTTLDTYRTDYETKETELKSRIKTLETETKTKIEALQAELTATILKYQNQLKDNEVNTAYQRRLANTEYANATYEAERNLFNARKNMAITELQIEVAKLKARGGNGGLINELNAYIGELGGKSFDRNSTYTANGAVRGSGFDSGGNWVEMNTVLDSLRTGDGSYRGEIYVKRPDGSVRKVYLLYNANRPEAIDGYATDTGGRTVNGFFNYADAYDLETGQKYAKGTDYVDDPRYPDGIDTVPVWLTKGERVFSIEESAAIRRLYGDVTNRELVQRLLLPAPSMPQLTMPILRPWTDIYLPPMQVPSALSSGVAPETVSMQQELNQQLLERLDQMSQQLRQLKQVNINIDRNGFAESEAGPNGITRYYQNLSRRS